jgi:hypothetical protein
VRHSGHSRGRAQVTEFDPETIVQPPAQPDAVLALCRYWGNIRPIGFPIPI